MSKTHTLVVTDANFGSYAIECPGVTDACREWRECAVKTCPAVTGDVDALHDADGMAHGTEHQYINDAWMTPTNVCYLQGADEMPEAAERLADQDELPAGRYEVTHSFDDGSIEFFQLAVRESAETTA